MPPTSPRAALRILFNWRLQFGRTHCYRDDQATENSRRGRFCHTDRSSPYESIPFRQQGPARFCTGPAPGRGCGCGCGCGGHPSPQRFGTDGSLRHHSPWTRTILFSAAIASDPGLFQLLDAQRSFHEGSGCGALAVPTTVRDGVHCQRTACLATPATPPSKRAQNGRPGHWMLGVGTLLPSPPKATICAIRYMK